MCGDVVGDTFGLCLRWGEGGGAFTMDPAVSGLYYLENGAVVGTKFIFTFFVSIA